MIQNPDQMMLPQVHPDITTQFIEDKLFRLDKKKLGLFSYLISDITIKNLYEILSTHTSFEYEIWLIYMMFAERESIDFLSLIDNKYSYSIWFNEPSDIDHQMILKYLINNKRFSSANYLFQRMDNYTREKITNITKFVGMYILPLTDIEVVLFYTSITFKIEFN